MVFLQSVFIRNFSQHNIITKIIRDVKKKSNKNGEFCAFGCTILAALQREDVSASGPSDFFHGEGVFRVPTRVPFRVAEKEPKGNSGALPLKTPFCFGEQSDFSSPCAANLLRGRRALGVGSAQFQTGHPVYRTVLPRSHCACCSASAVEGNCSIGFTSASGAVGTKHHFFLCIAVRQQGEMRQVGVRRR